GREEVRVKAPGDIETTSHEIAHLLDDRIPEIRRQWNPATAANARVRAELAGVSYDRTKLYEGFAEFVRLWATQPNQSRVRAPLFNAGFEGFINRSQYGPALRKMQRDMLNWFEQAAVDRAASKIGEGPDINSGLVSPLARFRQTVVDDLQAIKSADLG